MGSLRQSPTLNKLAAKLARILGEIGQVKKSGKNSFHNYDYVTENDLFYAVRDKLSATGIFVFTSTSGQHVEIIKDKDKDGEERSWALTTVETEHTFIDCESGEWFTVRSQGQGADNGDKGGYKAITGAMKYFLYKCFMIPTGDDPEADDKTDARGANRTNAKTTHAPPPNDKPREINTAMRDTFINGAWKKVKIHFGADWKGASLGALSAAELDNWCKWQPKPFQGKIQADDAVLRAALDAYQLEREIV